MVFKMRTFSLPRTKEELVVVDGSHLKRFSLKEIKLATNHFRNSNVVGRGGFGSVYRGRLDDGSLVAVKRSYKSPSQMVYEFQTEMEIGGSHASGHPNLLRLRGYCRTRTELILVYPFLMNRSVYSWLHDRPLSDPPLDWTTRKRIALGVAKALAHFHHASSVKVVHRDVKPSNILLDDQFEAVLCDFGIAKFICTTENEPNCKWVQRPKDEDNSEDDEEEESDHENSCFTKSCWNITITFTLKPDREESSWVFTKNEATSESGRHNTIRPDPPTHVTNTCVCGTMGYLDPDYLFTFKCSTKIDVFGYGVTLLQLISGQKPRLLNGDTQLYIWAKQLVDSSLRGTYIHQEMKQLIQLALSCTVLGKLVSSLQTFLT